MYFLHLKHALMNMTKLNTFSYIFPHFFCALFLTFFKFSQIFIVKKTLEFIYKNVGHSLEEEETEF